MKLFASFFNLSIDQFYLYSAEKYCCHYQTIISKNTSEYIYICLLSLTTSSNLNYLGSIIACLYNISRLSIQYIKTKTDSEARNIFLDSSLTSLYGNGRLNLIVLLTTVTLYLFALVLIILLVVSIRFRRLMEVFTLHSVQYQYEPLVQ